VIRVPEQEIGHMPARSPADARPKQERLRSDTDHSRVEIGQQHPGQFKPALVDHQTAGRRRPVQPRVVTLAAAVTNHPPRLAPEHLTGPQSRQLPIDLRAVLRTHRHNGAGRRRIVTVISHEPSSARTRYPDQVATSVIG
jgi:hypothetical protein